MNKIEQALKAAIVGCMAVKKSECVLVIADDGQTELGELFYRAARKYSNEVIYSRMPVLQNNGQEPPPAVAELMAEAEVIFMVTSRSLSHTAARRRASASGARVASMPGITRDMLLRTLTADYRWVKKISKPERSGSPPPWARTSPSRWRGEWPTPTTG